MRISSIPLAFLAVASSSVAMAADTHSESFYSMTSTGCGSPWVDECSTTWDGLGEDDMLEMSVGYTADVDPVYGVVLEGPSGTFPNAVTYDLPVTSMSDGGLEVVLETWSLTSTMDAGLRVQALDSEGVVLGTKTFDVNDTADENVWNRYWMPINSTSAVTMRVSVGVLGSSDILFLGNVELKYQADGGDVTTGAECVAYICVCPAGYTKTSCSYKWDPPTCTGEVRCTPTSSGDVLDTTTITGR